jgi:hypothetical protein
MNVKKTKRPIIWNGGSSKLDTKHQYHTNTEIYRKSTQERFEALDEP